MAQKEQQYKILICGDELVELKHHINDIPECRWLIPKIHKYKGDKPFAFTENELSWVVAILEAVVKDPQGYCIIDNQNMKIESIPKTDIRYNTCRRLFQRLAKEHDAIMDEMVKKTKAFYAKEQKSAKKR
jgi:hypothetical protein